jgi:hypothetical protein
LTAAASALPWITRQDLWDLAGGIVAGVVLIVGAVRLLHRSLGGGGRHRRAIAQEWSRHAIELPFLNRRYARVTSGIALSVMACGFVATVAASTLRLPEPIHLISLALMISGEMVFLSRLDGRRRAPAEARAARRANIEREMRDRTENISGAPARRMAPSDARLQAPL